ncbi:MAG: metallophosphoesterase [Elusimicrobia bacterium]|nr:metallophosphoesterase [Elusimicrobiota bacterium]
MDKKQLEKILVQSIEDVSKAIGKNPLDLSYNEWKGMVDGSLLEKHSLLGVRFSRLKEANFKVKLDNIDTFSLDIDSRALSNRKFNKSAIKESYFFEKLEEIGKLVFKDKIVAPKYSGFKDKSPIERSHNVFLSDLHFGSDLDGRECPHPYGIIEEARSLAIVTLETAEFKEQYRENTILNLTFGGDIIQGHLRQDERDGAPITEQICRSIYLLSQCVSFLSSRFRKINVRCVGGNHDRTPRHTDRATLQKWDNYSTVISFGVKMACQSLTNVNFEIPLRPYITYDSFDKKFFMTHGDTVFSVGYPGNNINTKNLEQQVNRINASLKDTEEYSLFVVGHVHFPSLLHLPNSCIVITNGCLLPPDPYSVSLGGLENVRGQFIWESVKGHAVGDSRFIRVDQNMTKDKSLDKIIMPFNGF